MNGNVLHADILVIDDSVDDLRFLTKTLTEQGYQVRGVTKGISALKAAQLKPPHLILLDIRMPEMDGYEVCRRLKANPLTADIPVIFLSALHEIADKIKAFELGGVDYVTKPFQVEEIFARVKLHLTLCSQQQQLEQQNVELIQLNEQLQQEMIRREQMENKLQIVDANLSLISEQQAEHWGISAFIGKSKTIIKILDDILRLQRVEKTNILVLGESGTGKELIARAIHFGGVRAKGPFIAVNCAAIPGELAESILFGHVRGAFTGAVNDRKGYFELASGGTLFLDEMGEMPWSLQAKLLRSLENGTFMSIGSYREKQVDVRVIAATNADLATKITAGEFRQDLYFRLAGYTVHLPPLRERQEDIPLLIEHFLSRLAIEMGRPQATLTPSARAALANYSFPGNARELRNILEHALISSDNTVIQLPHLRFIETIDIPVPVLDEFNGEKFISISCGEAEQKILAYVHQHGNITNFQCRHLLNLDYHHASYLLKKMSREGRLVRQGNRRGSYYQQP
ncbi:two component, sigma54 specific, transcriptional regulator, Fis family protein [Thioploca ingrica]|uniref:Two component, sigma54 specific, transcriptional regulator, Fis family protein n=1 Tax=Thioploca ingrica TaxID=40754 RepID=A0A090ADB5_9GAMM|nr:two component, sigma54 specific, transcriptional regulator, Fis family protein [Thioploca ingrica]